MSCEVAPIELIDEAEELELELDDLETIELQEGEASIETCGGNS